MPAIITHHLFGIDVLSRVGGGAFAKRDERDAFLLGNQGPDPLFFAVFTPQLVELKKMASKLHTQNVDATIDAMRRYTRILSQPNLGVVDAWLCGYLCHFALDSMTHPFVFALERSYTQAGVEGLGEEAAGAVHNQIEADLDMMMLQRNTGKGLREFVVPRQTLRGSSRVLTAVDSLLGYAVLEAYGEKLPQDAYARGVKDYRTSMQVLYSPKGIKRALVGMIERIFSPHSRAQASSHRADAGANTPYNNGENDTWVNPWTNDTNNSSFVELYTKALDVATDTLRLHEQGAPTHELTLGLDFHGCPR